MSIVLSARLCCKQISRENTKDKSTKRSSTSSSTSNSSITSSRSSSGSSRSSRRSRSRSSSGGSSSSSKVGGVGGGVGVRAGPEPTVVPARTTMSSIGRVLLTSFLAAYQLCNMLASHKDFLTPSVRSSGERNADSETRRVVRVSVSVESSLCLLVCTAIAADSSF